MMIPENAGGKPVAKQSIEILVGSEPIPQRYAAATIIAGIKNKRKKVFQITYLSIENLTVDNAKPAAKTATPALALAIKSKVGAYEVGILIPIKTKITARSGAAATGFLTASMIDFNVGFIFLVSFSPAWSSNSA